MKKSILFLCFMLTAIAGFCKDREPAVAGQFYPRDPSELTKTIGQLLASIPSPKQAIKPIALIVPHAGYIYSAKTAAHAYILAANIKPKVVIILGNSHRSSFNGAAIWPDGAFKTPLGKVQVNTKLAETIIKHSKNVARDYSAQENEHVIEVQLPFLQRTLKDFTILPIMLGHISINDAKETGHAIIQALKDMKLENDVLIIASTDLSHYPGDSDARKSDERMLQSLLKLDPYFTERLNLEIMKSNIPNMSCTMCSKEAVYTALFAAERLGADSVKLLDYSNSSDASQDYNRVVGYGAAVIFASHDTAWQKSTGGMSMNEFKVSPKAQEALLKIARQSIEGYLKTRKQPQFNISDEELKQDAAVFVTLTKNHNLRGCIGTTVAREPLYKAVSSLSLAAALEDSRFYPVTLEELKDIKIEISVLSPLKKVKNATEIVPDEHGVVVKRAGRSGLFLPQVWEHFKSKDEFMNELCSQKAGVEPAAWKDSNTELYIFTVFAFEEK